MTTIAIEAGLGPGGSVSEQLPKNRAIRGWAQRRGLGGVAEKVSNVLFATDEPNARIKRIEDKLGKGEKLTKVEKKLYKRWLDSQNNITDKDGRKQAARGGGTGAIGRGPRSNIGR